MSATTANSEPNDETEKVRTSPRRKAAIAFILGKALVVCVVCVVAFGVFSGLVYGTEKPIKTAARSDQDAADAEPRRITVNAGSMEASLIGVASMYNPYRGRHASGGKQTASGEFYDPAAWAAAIQIDLRELFGGVHYGRRYQPAYALVECCGKRAIVKINDVGPLRPGRVIDLDQRSMRYFDPSLRAGLIRDVKITLLSGNDWTPGPVESEQAVIVAAAQLPVADSVPGPNGGERLVMADAAELSGEERASEASESEQPAIIVAAQSPSDDRTPEPIGGKQPAYVGGAELSETDPRPVEGKQFASVVAEILPSEDPAPVASAQPASVTVAFVAASPSRKMGIAAAFVLISIGGLIVALPTPAPAGATEIPAAKPRSRRRRKSKRVTPRTRRTTSRRKAPSKIRQKTSLKSRGKGARKALRKTTRRKQAAVR
jgi:rare lipoprotein A